MSLPSIRGTIKSVQLKVVEFPAAHGQPVSIVLRHITHYSHSACNGVTNIYMLSGEVVEVYATVEQLTVILSNSE